MNKQSKFELLQEMELSRDEAEEFFDLQEEKNNDNKVFLPFSIVYLSLKHRLRVLPYLDLSQKEKVSPFSTIVSFNLPQVIRIFVNLFSVLEPKLVEYDASSSSLEEAPFIF